MTTKPSRMHSLRVRVLGTTAIAIALLGTALFFLAWQQQEASKSLAMITKGYLPMAKIVGRLDQDRERIDQEIRQILQEPSVNLRGKGLTAYLYTKEIKQNIAVGRIHAKYAGQLSDNEKDTYTFHTILTRLDRIDKSFTAYAQESKILIALAERDMTEKAVDQLKQQERRSYEMSEQLSALNHDLDSRVATLTITTERMQERATMVAVISLLLALAVALVLGFVLVTALRPIQQLQTEITRLSGGDYSGRIEVDGQDEIATLARQFNTMNAALEKRDKTLLESNLREQQSAALLARSERLALIGQMLAQITHEVRNPLNSLSLNAELLADEIRDLGAEESHVAWELLGLVSKEIERLNTITTRYLQLARRNPSTPTQCSVQDVIRTNEKLLAPRCAQTGTTITLALDDTPPIPADADQLSQALLNVLQNALNANATAVTIGLRSSPQTARITITDNGKGMTPEELLNATEPFYTNSDEGTGLGLAITKEIIEDHGGTLTLTPNPQGGMVVSFLLPRNMKDATLHG
jgi:signal transduction histidine kinase